MKLGKILFVLFIAGVSSCSGGGNDGSSTALTGDERYLVDAYVRIARAREIYPFDPARAETLFAAIDSTIDTTRIANTITALEADPERWIGIFRAIADSLRRDVPPPP